MKNKLVEHIYFRSIISVLLIIAFQATVIFFLTGCGGGNSKISSPSGTGSGSQSIVVNFPQNLNPVTGTLTGYALIEEQVDNSNITIKLERNYSEYSYGAYYRKAPINDTIEISKPIGSQSNFKTAFSTSALPADSAEFSTLTNNNGFFIIPNIPYGYYTLLAEKSSTYSSYKAIRNNIFISPNNNISIGKLKLTLTTNISGVVKDENGNVVEGAMVYLYSTPFITSTDAEGQFYFFNLPIPSDKQYRLIADKYPYYSTTILPSIIVSEGSSKTVELEIRKSSGVSKNPEVDLIWQRGTLYAETSQFTEAIAEFSKIVTNFTNEETRLRGDAQYKIALLYELTNNYDVAINEYKKFTNQFPNSDLYTQGILGISSCYYFLGKESESNNEINSYVATLSNDKLPSAYLDIANHINRKILKPQNSILWYTKLVSEFPDNALAPLAQFNIAEIYYSLSQYEYAISEYKKVVINYPNYYYAASSQNKIASIYRTDIKNYQNAINEYKNLILLFPNTEYAPDAYVSIANIYQEEKNYKSAINTLGELIIKYPNNQKSETALYTIAEIYDYRLYDKNSALTEYKEFVNKYPYSSNASSAQKKIGDIYRSLNEYTIAILEYRKVVDNYPTSWESSTSLEYIASIFENHLQQFVNALSSYKELLEQYPTYYNYKAVEEKVKFLSADKDKDGKNYAEELDAGTSDLDPNQ